MPTKQIGFDRFIEQAWLDATAAKVASGASTQEVRDYLWGLLDGILSGKKDRSARHKTITVLTRIWCPDGQQGELLRRLATKQVGTATVPERLALHWALTIVAYPFFRDVVNQIGRVTMLQEDVALAHLYRRMTELYGDRSSVPVAARRVVRSLVRWGALADTPDRGVYRRTPPVSIENPYVVEVLLHALVRASDQEALALDQVAGHPALFPFRVEPHALRVARMDSLEEHREFGAKYVKLKPVKTDVREKAQAELEL